MAPPTHSQRETEREFPPSIPHERELWRGQPEWIGYVSTLAAFVAVPTVPLLGWVGKPGWTGVIGVAGIVLSLSLVAVILRAGWRRTGYRYLLTTSSFYYVEFAFRRSKRKAHIIPLAAVAHVELEQRGWQRVLGLGDIYLVPYTVHRLGEAFCLHDLSEPEAVRNLIQRQLTAISEGEPEEEPTFAQNSQSVSPESLPLPLRSREQFLPLVGIPLVLLTPLLLGLFLWVRPDRTVKIEPRYSADDPIRFPDGRKRPRAQIMAQMETEVLPFAKRILASVVGGTENVTCETCHGENPAAKNWAMPAVVALPHTFRPGISTKRTAKQDDIQIHNALVGEASDYDNADTAEYMRRVVLPGMAGLLHRPVYDRSRPYGYNVERAAFGCYHCHQLYREGEP